MLLPAVILSAGVVGVLLPAVMLSPAGRSDAQVGALLSAGVVGALLSLAGRSDADVGALLSASVVCGVPERSAGGVSGELVEGSAGRRQKLSSMGSSLGEVTAFDATRAIEPRADARRGTFADRCAGSRPVGGLSTVGRLLSVKRVDEPRAAGAGLDGERTVDLSDDDFVVIPEQSVDDTDRGWGERSSSNDERLLADRPPHWD